eukprot:IDg12632t1
MTAQQQRAALDTQRICMIDLHTVEIVHVVRNGSSFPLLDHIRKLRALPGACTEAKAHAEGLARAQCERRQLSLAALGQQQLASKIGTKERDGCLVTFRLIYGGEAVRRRRRNAVSWRSLFLLVAMRFAFSSHLDAVVCFANGVHARLDRGYEMRCGTASGGRGGVQDDEICVERGVNVHQATCLGNVFYTTRNYNK